MNTFLFSCRSKVLCKYEDLFTFFNQLASNGIQWCGSTLSISSHPPTALTLSQRYVNSPTVSTSSHNLTSFSTASQIFPSHFLHVKFHVNFGATLFIPAHLSWIHLPHCRHKAELAPKIKPQTPHVSTFRRAIPCQAATDHYLGLPKANIQILLSKASFHYKNVFLSPSIVSLIWTKSLTYRNSLSISSGKFSGNVYHH